MPSGKSLVQLDTLRSLGFAGISAAYAAVGPALTVNTRVICITNNTAGDMIFSVDNTNASGQLFVAAGSFKLFDLQSNMNTRMDDQYVGPVGWQWYVKQVTAPVSGSVYIEVLY